MIPVPLQVVPFSPCAGLLEWVDNTLCLTEYLVGADRASGAHKRYAKQVGCRFVKVRFLPGWGEPANKAHTHSTLCKVLLLS